MKKAVLSFLSTACMLGILATLSPVTQVAQAQYQTSFYNFSLHGSYAMQFTGTVFLPSPFDAYNGAFSRNGLVQFDGNGNFSANVIANYSGTISNDVFSGTYVVAPNGTFTLTVVNLPIPAIPSTIPNVFTFHGTIANGGNNALISLTGVSVGGAAQTNIGSVITGQLIRQ